MKSRDRTLIIKQSKAKTSNLLLLESQSPKASRLCTLFSGASPRSSACRDRPSDRYSCMVVVPSHRQPSSHGATMPASRMRPSAQRERHDVRLLWGAGRACVGSRKGTFFCPFLQRRREGVRRRIRTVPRSGYLHVIVGHFLRGVEKEVPWSGVCMSRERSRVTT
jgi:hypothetical protein